MVDRYQDRPFPADDDYDRGGHQSPSKSESDPLAELARLIGQTDPFASIGGRANQPAPPRDPGSLRDSLRDRYPEPEPAPEAVDDAPAGPPPWMQRAAAQIPSRYDEPPEPDFESNLHPVQRYAASHAAPEPDYHQAPLFAAHPSDDDHHDNDQHAADPERYDDALYGQLPGALAAAPPEANYDEPYSYQDDYADGADEPAEKPRRGGMMTVAVVLALAVVGTGAAFAYRTYVVAPRSGEPPVFKADPNPIKVVPPTQSADASNKLIQDRMAGASGTEKIVSREEQPVDPNTKAGPGGGPGPRVVFPPLNQNTNPPTATSVGPGARPPSNAGNGTLGDEPRKIRTVPVHGDQADATPVSPPVSRPAPIVRAVPQPPAGRPTPQQQQSANAPLSLSPQAQAPQAQQSAPQPEARKMASNASLPQPIVPTPAAASGGGFLVQISSQRNEADAQASFKSLQGKYPAVLGSRSALIRRKDLGEKGVYYRAMVGPFASTDDANQFCGTLKTAGGNCVILKD